MLCLSLTPNSKKSPTSSTVSAAIAVPLDAKKAFIKAAERETHPDAKRALLAVIDNADTAVAQQSSMCGDTGLPRFYVKAGNDVQLEGGFVALENAHPRRRPPRQPKTSRSARIASIR